MSKVNDFEQVRKNDVNHLIHPFRHFETYEKGSMIFTGSDNINITDSEGKTYLDSVGGMWCMNIGYAREEMAEAIYQQVKTLPYVNPFCDQTSVPASNLAAKIASLTPGDLNNIFFGCNGSDANDTAVRMIHYYFNQLGKPTKKLLISREDAYHGSTYMSMSLTGIKHDHIGFDIADNLVHHLSCPNPYRRPDGMSAEEFCDAKVQELEDKILELGPDNVAAFFAEPVMGSGGCVLPPKGYHKKTLEVCRKYDVLYVSDEVVTAFGRLGHFFASEAVFDIIPDIIISAKGLTSGYLPLSATIISDKINEVISKKDGLNSYFCHGFTYSGHPVSCAAALKNIEIMERENIVENAREMGTYFEEQIRTLADLEIVGDIRGHRYMMCVENVKNKQTKELFPSDKFDIGELITQQCEKRGLIVRPSGHLNILSPPLTLTKQDIDFIVATLRESIEATTKDLKQKGEL